MASDRPQLAQTGSLGLAGTLRLGLFQGCLGCLAVIFAGMLNRVMISELGFPALWVGGALAFEQFVAPARVLVGQVSDGYPLAGRHRLPYIWLGSLAFCGLAVLSIPLIFQVAALLQADDSSRLAGGVLALCGLFAAYGLAISLASTPYLALVIDRTTEQERPRAVGIIWCLLTVGIVVGAISIAIGLRSLDGVRDPALLEPALLGFMLRVAAVVLLLTLVATLGMEPPARRSSGRSQASSRDDAITLRQSWALVTSSRQVLVFFLFLVLFTLALFLQDPILESYGADVFGMPIAATASLNALWGIGTLAGLLLAGLWIVPRLGKLATARLGCQLILASLLLLLVSGMVAQIPLLRIVMVLFGLAAGIGTNSALVLMLDLTLPEAAGTFVGVWGLAQAMSRALGKVIGGGLLDLGRWLQQLFPLPPGPFPPYALVLGVEALVALVALAVLSRVNLRQFREDTGRSLSKVLALEIG
ncbi:Transporter, major facilitator family protein [Cyanobium sp. NIES-981]|nr:BCD family MFS transporter [Cyanobium sp. NIES-981]SBO44783.1 Transporter, major facilitator family protein [Cyanobium sp. NIES-981]